MEMGMIKDMKESEDEQITRKRKKVDWFLFLSDDILFDILKRLPDAFLGYKAKYVCKRWFILITNRILLDHASFIHQFLSHELCTTRIVDIREEQQGLQAKEKIINLPDYHWIKTWCKEFVLISDPSKKESLYGFNLITKEGSYLPQLDTSCGGHHSRTCGVTLSFDRFKGIYKVLHMFMGPPIECHVLILRRDVLSRVSSKWKKIKVPDNMSEWWLNQKKSLHSDPISVQGRYFHWNVYNSEYLVSVDMMEEKIIQMPLPPSFQGTLFSSIFEMGGFLTLFDVISSDKAEIWILKDFQRMKWDKLRSITVENWCFRGPSSYIYPVSGTISKRYIIFMKCSPDSGMCSYDMETGIVKDLNINLEPGTRGSRCRAHSSAPTFI